MLPRLLSALASSSFLVARALASDASLDSNTFSPPVKVSLRSSWSAPDLLLEIIETIALEDPSFYFLAFDTLTSPTSAAPEDTLSLPASSRTDAQTHEGAITRLALAGVFTNPGTRFSFETALSLHAATPKIEAFYQYYSDITLPGHTGEQSKCLSWVDWKKERICNLDVLKERLSAVKKSATLLEEEEESRLLPFDHINPSLDSRRDASAHTAILYVSFESSDFRALHDALYEVSSAPNSTIQYVIRYIPPTIPGPKRNFLTGYGVGLDLKKMDYLALDDRRASATSEEASERAGSDAEVLAVELDDYLVIEALKDLPEVTNLTHYASPLEIEEVTGLTAKAAHLIATASDPLGLLRQLSQNFPKYANAIARRVSDPPEEFLQEVAANRMQLPPGFNGLWINGMQIKDEDINPLSLLRILREERKRMLSLEELGLSPTQAVDAIAFSETGPTSAPTTTLEGYFDASDRIEGGGVIVWWNNIEKDTRYARWPASLQALLRNYYGQFPTVRRNLNNIVVVLDLSLPSSLAFVSGPIPAIISRTMPFTWGVVPDVESETSRKVARLLYYSVTKYGRGKTIKLFKELADLTRTSVDLHKARGLFNELEKEHYDEHSKDSSDLPVTFEAVINSAAEDSIEKAAAYSARLSTTKASFAGGHAFINGKHFDFTENFLHLIQTETATQTQFLVEEIYSGRLDDKEGLDMSVYFYDLPTTAKRRNKYIYPSTKAGSLKVFDLPKLFDSVGIDRTTIDYLPPRGEEFVPLTIWVIGDFDDAAHVDLLREALLAMNTTTSYRLAYLHAPPKVTPSGGALGSARSASTSLYTLTSQKALANSTPEDLLSVLDRISPSLKERNIDAAAQAVLLEESHLHALLNSVIDIDATKYLYDIEASSLLTQEIGFKSGEMGLIINGRVIGPIDPHGMTALDFESLCSFELQNRVSPVMKALNQSYKELDTLEPAAYSELITMASSVISAAFVPDPSAQGLRSAPPEKRNRVYELLATNHSSFEIGDYDSAVIQVGAIIDPLSTAAQKWSSILGWLSQTDFVHTFVVLVPTPVDQLPLKRFYRYNVPGHLTFDTNGAQSEVAVTFHGLPPAPIYTLGMEVAQSWLVRPHDSPHDLDNIHLAALPPTERSKGVEAVFDLDFLVIEGHAREPTNAPPRGVQLQLTSINSTVPIADTLVMANLGYLQFRAKPGVFQLSIRPGRGREVFEIESVGNQGWDSPTIREAGDVVTLTSFEGLTLYPRLRRRTGMETAEVLDQGSSATMEDVFKPVVSWVKSYFNPSKDGKEVSTNVQAEINIFTVASGLLYERFVGIMILSVLKNTQSSVKFWFIENFLSPSFLEFIPHLAEAYGFQYELVTYKWPSWLRAQTEKQRVIWGYKILFLDVLFPMDLKKVIFVDADQIVRADLKELVDLDLHGAPYGYTPMGDDNVEMEGFRFWKTGYWKDFLKGSPYHISALYVIDLVRFRQLAAGDKLRHQYQGLSGDPNSLANLDQDLPNNLQHDVPIFSLPEDWLWCETWCSKDRLHRAKTIDLCQNPLTKEPKLSRARQIPEWEEYDGEIARFAQLLVEAGKIKSAAVAASVNELASIGSGKKASEDEAVAPSTDTGSKHDSSEL